MKPQGHPVVLLVVLASAQFLLVSLYVLALTAPAEATRPTNPGSFLNFQLSPNSVSPGSIVQVSGSLPIPIYGSARCTLSSANIFQGEPTCNVAGHGSISGSFQVNNDAAPGSYTVFIHVSFSSTWPHGSCSAAFTEYTTITSASGYYVVYTQTIAESTLYNCQVDDQSTLAIQAAPQPTTATVSYTTYLYMTITQISTTTKPREVCSQLQGIQAIVIASVAAIVAAVATRIYAKRRPGFDVEVRHGVDREEG